MEKFFNQISLSLRCNVNFARCLIFLNYFAEYSYYIDFFVYLCNQFFILKSAICIKNYL
jgi:hypothetical protein